MIHDWVYSLTVFVDKTLIIIIIFNIIQYIKTIIIIPIFIVIINNISIYDICIITLKACG